VISNWLLVISFCAFVGVSRDCPNQQNHAKATSEIIFIHTLVHH
jgi:hypothetical protein